MSTNNFYLTLLLAITQIAKDVGKPNMVLDLREAASTMDVTVQIPNVQLIGRSLLNQMDVAPFVTIILL